MSETNGVPNKKLVKLITPRLLISCLKLFHGIPVPEVKTKKPSRRLTEVTVNHGFVYSPLVIGNYTEEELISISEDVSKEVGISPAQINSSFHKSWRKVRDAPIYQLLIEQVFHYFTTYGYEGVGIYDPNTVFIPRERLDIPQFKDGGIKLSLVNGYKPEALKSKLMTMLESGIALGNMDDLMELVKFCGLDENDVPKIRNKEIMIRIYKELDMIPSDPTEFLRLLLLETGNDLLIINNKTIAKIKAYEDHKKIRLMFKKYDFQFGAKRLAEIFHRFKPLFLAFKTPDTCTIINLIGRLSKKYHKPMKPSLLNELTGLLERGMPVSETDVKAELCKVNIFRKIRLLQALHYRTLGREEIVYKIRNGKGYSTKKRTKQPLVCAVAANTVYHSILKDLSHLKGKKIYIPENITYSLPATAKQFTGNIPSGSYVTIPKDLIFGVYWDNVNGHRIDLDLSLISIKNGKMGWNGRIRSNNVLFSGDMTDATNGASELFYVNKDFEDTMVLYVNYFNHREYGEEKDLTVPFKIVVGEEHPNTFGQNYMIDPNHIQAIAKTEINTKQKVLGLVQMAQGEGRFYFSETSIGYRAVSGGGEHNDILREYLIHSMTNMITLNGALKDAGAILIDEPTKGCIDLSPNNLEKDTFIKLLTGGI